MSGADTSLIHSYYDLLFLRRRINKMSGSSSSKSKDEIVRLENEANELAKTLSIKSGPYRSMLEENEMTWLDIRNRLKPDEAAVEFSEFRYEKEGKISDSILYFALVLRKKDTIPNLVALGDEKTLLRLCPPVGNPMAGLAWLTGTTWCK